MAWLVEDPTPIYWIAGVLALALVCAVFVTKRLLYAGLAGGMLLLAGGVWLLDYLVVTDREAVTEKCLQLAEAAERGDVEGIGEILARDCTASIPVIGVHSANRQQILAEARLRLPPQSERRIVLWVVEITSSRDGKAHTCHCDVRASGDFGVTVGGALVKAEFTFTREDDGQWRVRQMTVRDYRQP